MPVAMLPFAEIVQYDRYLSGNVYDFGHCFSERPASQLSNPNYVCWGFIPEPNTDMMVTKPFISWNMDNDCTVWAEVGEFWSVIYPAGNPTDRTLMKWDSALPDDEYELAGGYYDRDMGAILEIGLSASASGTTDPIVSVFISNTIGLTFKKRAEPVLSVNDGAGWHDIGTIPLAFKALWKDTGTDLVWIIPFNGGLLFSADGEDFVYIKPYGGLEVPSGEIVIMGSGGVAVFGCHEITYADASILSDVVYMGSIPITTPTIRLMGWIPSPDSVSPDIIPVDATSYRYQVTVPGGTGMTGIAKVNVDHAPYLLYQAPTGDTVSDVEEVEECIPEDPAEESCTIRIANWAGIHTGQFKRFDTLSWYFGWMYDSGTPTPVLRNTGIVSGVEEVRNEHGDPVIEVVARSPLVKVKDQKVVYAPDYSGWTVAAALSDSLLRCGIPLEMQSIQSTGRWSQILPDGGEKGMWQPEAGSDWVKWFDELVRYLCGGWGISQRDGTVRIEDYPEVEDQTFDGCFVIYPNQIEEIHYQQPEEDIAELRNFVYVEGRTPDGYPIGAVLRDEDSLYNPHADNYVGYLRPLYISNPSYCTQEIVNWVCYVVFEHYRKLRCSIELTTNPMSGSTDLYPGALMEVRNTVGPSDWMIVRAVSSRLRHSQFSQTIFGHYISA